MPVGDSNTISLNATLTDDPSIKEDYLSIPIDGSFVAVDSGADSRNTLESFMPEHNLDGKQVQIFISEFSLNSALRAYHEQGALTVSQKVPSSIINQIFPNFEDVFGEDFNYVTLEIKTTHDAPQFNITISNGTALTGNVMIVVQNPMNEKLGAAYIELAFNASCNLTIGENFNLTGSIDDIQAEVKSVRALFKNTVTVSKLQSQIEVFKNLATDKFSRHLAKGLVFPMPHAFLDGLSNSRLVTRDHYLLIEADPGLKHFIRGVNI